MRQEKDEKLHTTKVFCQIQNRYSVYLNRQKKKCQLIKCFQLFLYHGNHRQPEKNGFHTQSLRHEPMSTSRTALTKANEMDQPLHLKYALPPSSQRYWTLKYGNQRPQQVFVPSGLVPMDSVPCSHWRELHLLAVSYNTSAWRLNVFIIFLLQVCTKVVFRQQQNKRYTCFNVGRMKTFTFEKIETSNQKKGTGCQSAPTKTLSNSCRNANRRSQDELKRNLTIQSGKCCKDNIQKQGLAQKSHCLVNV